MFMLISFTVDDNLAHIFLVYVESEKVPTSGRGPSQDLHLVEALVALHCSSSMGALP